MDDEQQHRVETAVPRAMHPRPRWPRGPPDSAVAQLDRVRSPSLGRSAIQAAMQQLLDMGARSLDVEPLDVREAGKMTIEYGRYTLGIEPDGGAAVSDVGKYVVVHEAQHDGSTKIALDIFNSNAPLPA